MLSRIFKLQTVSLGNAIARSFSRIPSSVDVNQDMDSKEKIAEKAVLYLFMGFSFHVVWFDFQYNQLLV
jgi:hypothetical protein